jgi:class 3 adenylate cyclase/CHASE2 domain-containing sensor protein
MSAPSSGTPVAPRRRALAFFLIALAAAVAHHAGLLSFLNGALLDAQFALWRTAAPQPAPRDVAVIGIDVDDLRTFDEPRDFWHPNYGRLLAALAKIKPAIVGMDVVLPERSYQHLVPGLDHALLQGLLAIRGTAPVVLARTVDDFSNFREIFAPYVAIAGPDAVGSVVVCKDEDEVVRRFDEYLCDPNRTESVPSLAGLMAKRMGVERSWRGFIDYRIGEAIQYLPFREVVKKAEAGDAGLAAALGDKPVLLGFILPFEDRKTVPVSLARWEPGNRSVPGVLVHAQILRSMLNGGLLQPARAWAVALLVLAGAAFVLLPSGARTLGLFALFVVLLAGAALWLMSVGWVLEAGAPALAAAGAVAVRYVDDSIADARERAVLRRAFGGSVSPQVMRGILSGRIAPGLTGQRQRVCILFSDVRNFTTRSEHMAAEVLIDMLNRYFTEMTQSVHEHGGTVDKFIGDGMMCFFGAPQPLPNAVQSGVAAARDMLARLERLNGQFAAQGLEPMKIGIGLHYGEVVLGHIGSAARHEYTAIGDAVNTASRVEGLTKGVGYALVITREVYDELPEKQDFVELGAQGVKGRSAVVLYGYTPSRSEALGDPNEQTQRMAVYGK